MISRNQGLSTLPRPSRHWDWAERGQVQGKVAYYPGFVFFRRDEGIVLGEFIINGFKG